MVDVKMKYPSMEKMQKEFHGAHKQMEDAMREMKKLAKMMEDGALQGSGGDAFRDAINTKLLRRMKDLTAKMAELEKDIKDAIGVQKGVVTLAKGRFSN
jgi:uncharacterized protein YukE